MHKRLNDKPGITKGGQHTVALDAGKRFILAYTPHHSNFKRPHGFGQEGPAEVHRLVQQFDELTGEEKIFEKPVHFTMDFHFSGDNVVQFLGEKGYGATMTTRRNHLCKDVPNKYFHHWREAVTQRSKAARFENPIVAVDCLPTFWIGIQRLQGSSDILPINWQCEHHNC